MTGPTARQPLLAGWEITRQCNLTCPHCFSAAAKRPHNELTTAEGRDLIAAMARIGVKTIGWTGGEPLLRGDLEELTACAVAAGIRCSITSNGILLDKNRARSIKDSGCHSIQISLDGSTPERNHRIRRATHEDFYKIIDGIRFCQDLKIPVTLAMLIGQENLDDAYEMVKLVKRMGIKELRFCGYTPAGRGKWESVKERLSFTTRLAELAEFIEIVSTDDSVSYFFDPGFGPIPPTYHFHTCVAGVETFYLKSNGDVFPCTSLLYKQFLVGNVRTRSLEDIWNDPAMPAMSRAQEGPFTGLCGTCDNLDRCRGACRGAAFAYTGDLKSSYPVCLYQEVKRGRGKAR